MDDLRHRHRVPYCVRGNKLLRPLLLRLAASAGVLARRALRLAGNVLSRSDWGGWLGWGEAGFQVARDVPVTSGPGFLLSLGLYNAGQTVLRNSIHLVAISVMSMDLDMQDHTRLCHAHDVFICVFC